MKSCALRLLICTALCVLFNNIQTLQSIKFACGPGKPCLFISKEHGVVDYEERPSLNQTYPVASDSWKLSGTKLFYSIASYRDKLCPNTLFQAFTKAAYPHRVMVGLVQQNYDGDVDCLIGYCRLMFDHLHPNSSNNNNNNSNSDSNHATRSDAELLADCPFRENVRVTRIDAIDAKGPTWARGIASQLVADEEFCMQTDAHMDLVQKWDTGMMNMWALANNEYAVLSTYVYDSTMLKFVDVTNGKGINDHHEASVLCKLRFDGMHGMPRNCDPKFMVNMPHPKLTNMIWGAGLSFSKCHAERKVPNDPHLPFIFDGEEFSRALRLWTWGYDIYSPHRVYIVHNYLVAQADPKRGTWHWENRGSKAQKNVLIAQSVRRLRLLLGMPLNDSIPQPPQQQQLPLHPTTMTAMTARMEQLRVQQSRFGLGDRRSLQQAIQFSGVDTTRLTTGGDERCGNVDFVAFQQHPWGAEYLPRYDAVTEEFVDVRDPGSIYYDRHDAFMRKAWIGADDAHRKSLQQQQQQQVIQSGVDRRSVKAKAMSRLRYIDLHFETNIAATATSDLDVTNTNAVANADTYLEAGSVIRINVEPHVVTLFLLLFFAALALIIIPSACGLLVLLCGGSKLPSHMKNLIFENSTKRSIKII